MESSLAPLQSTGSWRETGIERERVKVHEAGWHVSLLPTFQKPEPITRSYLTASEAGKNSLIFCPEANRRVLLVHPWGDPSVLPCGKEPVGQGTKTVMQGKSRGKERSDKHYFSPWIEPLSKAGPTPRPIKERTPMFTKLYSSE